MKIRPLIFYAAENDKGVSVKERVCILGNILPEEKEYTF
jgi:hypothetical protein